MFRVTLLAIIAGYADTIGYLHLNAFAGLMTGNTILMGIELATAKYRQAAFHGAIIAMFLFGVIFGRIIVRAGLEVFRALLVTSGLLIVSSLSDKFWGALLLALGMGIQNSAANRFGGITLNHVFITGNLQKIGEEFGGFEICIDGLSIWLMRIAREIGRGTSMQALRERRACQERADAHQAALPVQSLRPELHRHAPTRQTAGPEGGGRAALCQRPLDESHRQAPGCLDAHYPGLAGAVRRRLRPEARAGRPSGGDRARRDVALSEKKSEPLWIWKAWDRASGQLVDWECGGRDKATCERLIERLKRWRTRLYCADDYAVYGVLLPVGQLYTGKDETQGVERDNARQRHWLARFRRRSIVVSKTKRMVDVSIALFARFAGNNRITDLLSMLA